MAADLVMTGLGPYTFTSLGPPIMGTSTQTASPAQSGGFAIQSYKIDFTQAPGSPAAFTGTFSFAGIGVTDIMSGTFSGSAIIEPPGSGMQSMAGTWMITSSSGAYAGLVGSGSFSGFFVAASPTAGTGGMTWLGSIVPTPGTAALLAAAGLVGVRRRRSV